MGWRRWTGILAAALMVVVLFAVVVRAESITTAKSSGANAMRYGYWLNIDGDRQARFSNDGRDGRIQITSFNHEVISPRDAASGQASGKRQHKPMIIRKEIDKSSPLLYRAWSTNENLKSVRMAVTSADGSILYSVTMSNGSVAGITQGVDENGFPYEELSLTYQKIEWTWTDGGITAMDDWDSNR